MTEEPTRSPERDGPLMREAYERADAIDRAEEAGERRRAWVRFVPAAAAAFVENWVREAGLFVAALMAVIVILAGATSGSVGWIVAGAVSGVAGLVLILWAALRRWSLRWQWLTIVGVIAWQVAVLVGFGLSDV